MRTAFPVKTSLHTGRKTDFKIAAVLRNYKYLNDNRELAAGSVIFNARRKNKILGFLA